MTQFEHIIQITSIKDPRVSEARELTSASGRARQGKCLLEGVESIQWAIETRLPIEYIFYKKGQPHDTLHTQLSERAIPCYATTEGILKKISDTSYLVPYIGVARVPAELPEAVPMGDFVVVLDNVQDHGNIGTIIRTASAFGIRDIALTNTNLDIYYKKIVSASRGRSFEVRLKRFRTGAEAVTALKRQGYQVVATSPYAKDVQSLVPLQAKPVALVVGNETSGIAADIVSNADIVVQIPMSGQIESLNVGVATGISLYELKFRMILTMLINYIRANLGREVNVTGILIQQAFDAQIRQSSDLNGQQVILLMMLICDHVMSLEEISREIAVTNEERSTLLRPLFDKGYIKIAHDDQHSIVPTEAVERTIAQLWSIVERAEQAVLAGFSDDERAQFTTYLKRIQENCQHIIDC